jgi:flagellar hook assembly protein FlgD
VLDVFDVAGRRLRGLVAERRAAGRHDIRWDGRDDRGQALGAGTYFVRLRTPADELSVRVVRVR